MANLICFPKMYNFHIKYAHPNAQIEKESWVFSQFLKKINKKVAKFFVFVYFVTFSESMRHIYIICAFRFERTEKVNIFLKTRHLTRFNPVEPQVELYDYRAMF